MPRLRAEQFQASTISDAQLAVKAAIRQSKIASDIADPNGWISKGSIVVLDSIVSEATSGYQEFGLNVSEGTSTGLKAEKVYHIKINNVDYSIDTTGQTEPISYTTLVSLIQNAVSASFTCTFVGGDIRITNNAAGFGNNVYIEPNAQRHRLTDFLTDFTDFEEPVKASGLTWGPEHSGRMFFAKDEQQLYLGITTPPYYQAVGGESGWNGVTEVVEGNLGDNWDGNGATQFSTSTAEFELDGSNLFVYWNGQLLEKNQGGIADYLIVDTNTIQLTGGVATAEDKITFIINETGSLNGYATKAWVNNKLTGEVTLTGDTEIGGHIFPSASGTFDLGKPELHWRDVYLEDSIRFRPLGEATDKLRIYRNVSGTDTQLKIQVGPSANEMVIFEDSNNNMIMSIDGSGNVNIPGDLTVTGTTTYVDETNSQVSDADFIIKEATVPVDGDASYQVQRASGNAELRWNDSNDRWQAVFGQDALTTSNILTEYDLDGGINLDNRYFNLSKIVTAGSTEEEAAVKYAGVYDVGTPPNGVFYGGTIVPNNTTRLNYNGHLYVKALTADDAYISANTLYINNKPVLQEAETGEMLMSASPDQSVKIETTGTGSFEALSENTMKLEVNDHTTDKHISLINNSVGGDITLTTASTGTGEIQLSSQTEIDLSAPIIDINGAMNVSGLINGNISGTATTSNQVRGVNFYTGTTDPTATTRLNMDGYFYATRVYNAVYNDLAEFMPKAEEAEPGQVLIMTENGVAPSRGRGEKAVVGVYSDTFGQALGADDQENKLPVGLSGRVDVWISEPCEIGDLLISGDKPGFASVKRSGEDGEGKVIGKVVQNKDDSDPERVSMLIMMK